MKLFSNHEKWLDEFLHIGNVDVLDFVSLEQDAFEDFKQVREGFADYLLVHQFVSFDDILQEFATDHDVLSLYLCFCIGFF